MVDHSDIDSLWVKTWVARLGLGKNLTGLSPTVDESLVVKLGVQGTKLLALV